MACGYENIRRAYIIMHIAMLALDCTASASAVLLSLYEPLFLMILRIAVCCPLDADVYLALRPFCIWMRFLGHRVVDT